MTATDRPCPAALIVNGDHYPCDWPTDKDGRHEGTAHTNQEAGAIWQGVPVAALEHTRETFALGAAWALGDDEEAPAALKARLAAVEALADEWERFGGDNPGAIGIVSAIRAALAPVRPAIPTAAQITADTVADCLAIADKGHERAKAAGQ